MASVNLVSVVGCLFWAMVEQTRQKELLVAHLNTIIMEMTKKKEARLQELEKKLRELTESREPGFEGFTTSG